jgi:hypothetical protein
MRPRHITAPIIHYDETGQVSFIRLQRVFMKSFAYSCMPMLRD